MAKFYAAGGHGCILAPALPLGVVNESNASLFVTKISDDAEKEYDTAMYASQKAPGTGIFPVDLICGISRANVGPEVFESIQDSCKKQLTSAEKRTLFSAGKAFPEWCAIQYPRFQQTFYHFSSRPKVSKEIRFGVANDLIEKLNRLHAQGIYHMDIKEDNVGVLHGNFLYADWGLTFVMPTKIVSEEDIDDFFSSIETLLEHYEVYYTSRCHVHFKRFLDTGYALVDAALDDARDAYILYLEKKNNGLEEKLKTLLEALPVFLNAVDWGLLAGMLNRGQFTTFLTPIGYIADNSDLYEILDAAFLPGFQTGQANFISEDYFKLFAF